MFLKDIVLNRHTLEQLVDMVDRNVFNERLSPTFCEVNGRTRLPVRLMAVLHCLKYIYGLSDVVVEGCDSHHDRQRGASGGDHGAVHTLIYPVG